MKTLGAGSVAIGAALTLFALTASPAFANGQAHSGAAAVAAAMPPSVVMPPGAAVLSAAPVALISLAHPHFAVAAAMAATQSRPQVSRALALDSPAGRAPASPAGPAARASSVA